jgi:hypothetical protein
VGQKNLSGGRSFISSHTKGSLHLNILANQFVAVRVRVGNKKGVKMLIGRFVGERNCCICALMLYFFEFRVSWRSYSSFLVTSNHSLPFAASSFGYSMHLQWWPSWS